MEQKNDIIIGLDFGTTNTVISYFNKNPIIFKDSIKDTIPTKICFDKKISCGNYIPINLNNSKNVLSNFKTKISTKTEYFFNNTIYTENEVLIIFFKHIKNLLDKKFSKDNSIYHTVITVPSNFNDNQRKIILNVANIVGFNILRIINEPTAAAFSYGLNNCIEDENILVFDIGGGTLDISILEIDNNFFETIDSIGINDLGGNDFSKLIYNNCLEEFYKKINKENISIEQTKLIQLMYQCNKAKEKLAWVDSCNIHIDNFYKCSKTEGENVNYNMDYNLDKIKFKNISKPLLDRIRRKINYLKSKYKISKLILVGGSSRLELIQNLLEEEFKIKPDIHNNLQHVVSLGACYYGALIRKELNDNEIILVDNLPLSLGIETAEGTFSIIIPKNTPLPAKRSQKYTIDTPGEENVIVKVYQGERSIASKNYMIGEFEFNKISKTSMPIITITFKVDINGLINVTITDKHSGDSKDILIRNIDDNVKDNLEKILKEAEESKDMDDNEMIKNQLYYKIEIRINSILDSIKCNNLLKKEQKDNLTLQLLSDLDNLQNMIIPDLIKLDKTLDDKFFTFNNTVENTDENIIENNMMNIEDVIIKEKKEFLNNKINFYMTRNITEFQRDCLKKVNIFVNETENINQKDIEDKLNYIKELFSENYKEELSNLCIFLKNEIENFNLDLNKNQYNILGQIVNKYINMINQEKIINYKEEIDNLNNICENIMKKK